MNSANPFKPSTNILHRIFFYYCNAKDLCFIVENLSRYRKNISNKVDLLHFTI